LEKKKKKKEDKFATSYLKVLIFAMSLQFIIEFAMFVPLLQSKITKISLIKKFIKKKKLEKMFKIFLKK